MTLDEIRQELSDASRILAMQGLLDAFGHVSRRDPYRADRFMISRSLAPAMVTPADILELDLNGAPVSQPGARVFLERFIHAEIYRHRPDVHAVVHSHAKVVLPFCVVPSVRVRPICHTCGHLRGVPAPFDLADHVGPTSDLLIRDQKLGAALARHLADATVVLMRGHGFTAVGNSVPQTTFRAIHTARNCEVQMAAIALGQPVYLSDAEALACDETTVSQIDRAWDLWRHECIPSAP